MTELEKKIKKIERTIQILDEEIHNFNEDGSMGMWMCFDAFENLMAHREHERKRLEKLKKRLISE